MSRALSEYMITGVKTTIPFQQAIMQNSDFRRGKYHTGFVEKLSQSGIPMVEAWMKSTPRSKSYVQRDARKQNAC